MNEIQDRDKIKPYNATKYLRQMKYLPDVTPLCGIFLFLLPLFMAPIARSFKGSRLWVPEAEYAHHEPLPNENTPCIGINEIGELIFNNKQVNNIDILSMIFKRILKENRFEMKIHKVLLTIDDDTPWGKVCEVMRVLKDNQIKVIGLITQGTTSFIDLYEQQKLYRKKGLRLPESAR
jgi:biopolymer transport protein ExbD